MKYVKKGLRLKDFQEIGTYITNKKNPKNGNSNTLFSTLIILLIKLIIVEKTITNTYAAKFNFCFCIRYFSLKYYHQSTEPLVGKYNLR